MVANYSYHCWHFGVDQALIWWKAVDCFSGGRRVRSCNQVFVLMQDLTLNLTQSWLATAYSLAHGSVVATDSYYCRHFGVDQALIRWKTVKILVVFLSDFDKICKSKPAYTHNFQSTKEDIY